MKFFLRVIGSVLLGVVSFAALLFVPAGTLRWERAWVIIGVVGAAMAVTMVVAFRDNKELLRERRRGLFQKGQPLADKLVLAPFVATFYAQIICIPLDVWRWHLLPPPGAVWSALGMVMFLAGWMLMTLVFRQNAVAVPVVKYQKERNQRVIDTGVYAVVRHPMYAGAALLLPGLALWLESSASALFSLVPTALLVVRIGIEERFLSRELPGYAEYAKRVRWRFVPGVW
jgi:protein-S-isoprenylcysteine O-methyltransferase Ste14